MDTATFAHPNATARTLRVTAALVEAGAPLSEISRRIYRTKPDAQLAFFGRVLARLERLADGLVVASTMSWPTSRRRAPRSEHSEGIVDLLAQAETAEVALLLKEKGPETRLSVRTRPGGVDATVLCGTWARRARPGGRRVAPAFPCGGPGGRPARRRALRPGRPAVRRADARVDGILVRRQAGRSHLPRRRGPRAPPRRHATDRARRDPRPVRLRRAAPLPGGRHAGGGVPPRRRQGLPGDRHLRRASTTDDLEGELVAAAGPPPTREAVAVALGGLPGPPGAAAAVFSARKVGGRRAYALARRGETPSSSRRP